MARREYDIPQKLRTYRGRKQKYEVQLRRVYEFIVFFKEDSIKFILPDEVEALALQSSLRSWILSSGLEGYVRRRNTSVIVLRKKTQEVPHEATLS